MKSEIGRGSPCVSGVVARKTLFCLVCLRTSIMLEVEGDASVKDNSLHPSPAGRTRPRHGVRDPWQIVEVHQELACDFRVPEFLLLHL